MLKIPIFLLIWAYLYGAYAAPEYYVESMPGLAENNNLKLYSGHIEVNKDNGNSLFFLLAENKYIVDKQRTVIWLNGGPGCSSMDGAFLENGPFKMTKEGVLMENQGGWNEFCNVIFVDQPAGTGFSYSLPENYPHGLTQTVSDFLVFLDSFFKIFPQYKNDELYITGESFSGQYVPYIADAILKRNEQDDKKKYNLKGILVGNGWIDPLTHYKSYLPFAVKNEVVKKGSEQERKIQEAVKSCELAFSKKDLKDIQYCDSILSMIIRPDLREDKKCVNMYDLRLKYPTCDIKWPDGGVQLGTYLRKPEVLKALNINNDKVSWQECNLRFTESFLRYSSPPSVELLPGILSKIQVVLYSGDKDIICNHLGTEDLISNLEWNGRKGFLREDGTQAPRLDWVFMDKVVGYYQYDRNLTYIIIKDASHMVPYDKPLESQDMLNRFLGIDQEVIKKIRESKAKSETNLFIPNSKDNDLYEKQKIAWRLYYHIVAIILIFILIGIIYLTWRHYRNHKMNDQYIDKFSHSSDSEYWNENGVQYYKNMNRSFNRKNDFQNFENYPNTIYNKTPYAKTSQTSQTSQTRESSVLDYNEPSHTTH
ncbi:hypothetical protein T552_01067 [Pneumocystis carinii B80]|uniref:Pheromone-processing carboxypeptidase KEX1 n=1 Tax=Pneumocystis carinii (strain B80) TaxID=1408658 RepID=A0A0W4ZNC7_PNEC8|nr:hypothetical protein T552_01067 [Pneumocystis carinii B80]KTW29863.1 hypothetical protein T552_01067 [Pneumocystis carinii B80]